MKKSSLALLGILTINIFLRLIYVFYGYIATEEGTLIYNQKLAYSSLLPFVHYDAWNSLLNDYLIGWYQVLVHPTILTQRYFGLLLSLIVFIVTLLIAQSFKNSKITFFTAIFLTFGSYTYLYLSSIPYSEQTMTLFLMLSIWSLFNNKRLLSLLFSTLATLIRIQAAPALLILWLYMMARTHTNDRFNFIKQTTAVFVITFFILSPFLAAGPQHLLYAFTWPFFADKILIYQQGSQINTSTIFSFLQEAFRDYGVFILLIIYSLSLGIKRLEKRVVLLLLISCTLILTGLIHIPPYASYIYPAVPLLSLSLASLLSRLPYISSLVTIILIQNFILFPHYKYLKTSLATMNNTPHALLSDIAQVVRQDTTAEDEVLSLFIPAATAADRKIIPSMNRGPFSLSLLDESTSRKFHLTNNSMLRSIIASKRVKLIIFPNTYIHLFGKDEGERKEFLQILDEHYSLLAEFPQFRFIDGSNAAWLRIYEVKSQL